MHGREFVSDILFFDFVFCFARGQRSQNCHSRVLASMKPDEIHGT